LLIARCVEIERCTRRPGRRIRRNRTSAPTERSRHAGRVGMLSRIEYIATPCAGWFLHDRRRCRELRLGIARLDLRLRITRL